MRRAGLGLAVWMVAAAAHAEADSLSFAWVAPETCPTREEVLARVRGHLGAAPDSLPNGAPEVVAEVTQSATGYALELKWTLAEASESRHIEASTCNEVARAAALVIALAIDPNARLDATPQPSVESQTSTDASVPAIPPPSRATPPAAVPPSPAPLPEPKFAEARGAAPTPRGATREWSGRATIGLEGGVEVGALPEPAAGLGVGAEAEWGQVALGLQARWFGVAQAENAAGHAHFSEGMLALVPCATQRWARAGLSGCVTAELAATYATGRGVDHPDTRLVWNARLGAGWRVQVTASRGLRVGLGAWVLGMPQRPQYVLGGVDLFRPESLQARLLAGFDYEWGRGRRAE